MAHLIRFLGIGGLLGLCWGCINDVGNYTYESPEDILPIDILGLYDTVFVINEMAVLKPEIKGLEDESNYWFTWYTYSGGQGISERDTIGTERNLSFQVDYPSGEERTLVYEIKDKRTGVFVNQKITISCVSAYSQGWLILKDENGQTDIDVISPNGALYSDILYNNIQCKLQGKAVKIVNQAGYYRHQQANSDGTVEMLENLNVWHVLSSEGMATLNPDNLSIYKNFEDEFYAAPEDVAPQDFISSYIGGDLFFMNAGQLYSISGMVSNIGKFGYARQNANDLFPKILQNGDQDVFAFSRETKSFVYTHLYNTTLDTCELPDKKQVLQVSSTNMNADVIALLQKDGSVGTAWALMKSISGQEEYYLADIAINTTAYPFVDFDTIPATRNLVRADVYAANHLSSIWYAKDNVLSYYTKEASDEMSFVRENIYPFPSEEMITWMEQWETQYLLVITNSAKGWKLYRFELEAEGLSPNINSGVEPEVWSGQGTARYALWIGNIE